MTQISMSQIESALAKTALGALGLLGSADSEELRQGYARLAESRNEDAAERRTLRGRAVKRAETRDD